MIAVAIAVCGGFAVLFALLAFFQRTLYGSAFCLLVVLLQVAASFYLMGARLLGCIQALVYAGAIAVLVVMAVMASPPRVKELWSGGIPKWLAWLAILVPALEFAGFARFAGSADGAAAALPLLEKQMALLLFGRWALLTEVVGLLILLAALSVVREDAHG